jgi:hypothetical protein
MPQIDFKFSALDMACFSLIMQTNLPELVPDPIGTPSEKNNRRVQQFLDEFLTRQQGLGLLTVSGDEVVFQDKLAVALAPWSEGILAVKHKSLAFTRTAEYDKILYLSETQGVTIIQNEKGFYRVTWYPDMNCCSEDFYESFGFKEVSEYNDKPFKICEEALLMDNLIGASSKNSDQQFVDEFAQNHSIETDRLQAIISSVMRESGDVVFLDIGRNSLLGDAAMSIKLVLKEQHLMKMIFTPHGDKISLESFSREGLWDQLINF